MPEHESLTIAQVADKTGLSVHALRFYERQELLIAPVDRSSGGRRRYSDSDVEWLLICTKLRASGMSLNRLREFVNLARQGPGNEPERLQILRDHQSDVEEKLRHLHECLEVITHKVGVYEKHIADDDVRGLWDPSVVTRDPSR